MNNDFFRNLFSNQVNPVNDMDYMDIGHTSEPIYDAPISVEPLDSIFAPPQFVLSAENVEPFIVPDRRDFGILRAFRQNAVIPELIGNKMKTLIPTDKYHETMNNINILNVRINEEDNALSRENLIKEEFERQLNSLNAIKNMMPKEMYEPAADRWKNLIKDSRKKILKKELKILKLKNKIKKLEDSID